MKAVISNRIYLEGDEKFCTLLREELTYKIPSFSDEEKPLIIRNFSTIRPGLMSIPVGRTDLIPASYEVLDKRVKKDVEFPPFKFLLRHSQAEVHDNVNDNCIINAKVSWGKTFTGMAIAGKLGQKTLVVVHTLALMHQWAKEVRKVYGFEPGLIGDGHFNYAAPITIGNVRSLYTRMDVLCKEFGTIIMDEMHHVSSPTFSKVIDRSYARYKIGLSGTIERKDGKHVLFKDFFSNKVFKPPRENSMTPRVHAVDTGIRFPGDSSDGWANRVTALKDMIEYRRLVAALAANYAADGHKVLVVSDRTDFLKYVAESCNGALIIGEVGDREAEFTKMLNEMDVLCGTQSIMSEGISHDPLSVLIMATPINNMPLLEQLIGRIVRLCPGKLQPIVVDLRLRGKTTERQFMNRLGHYMKEGYDVEYL